MVGISSQGHIWYQSKIVPWSFAYDSARRIGGDFGLGALAIVDLGSRRVSRDHATKGRFSLPLLY